MSLISIEMNNIPSDKDVEIIVSTVRVNNSLLEKCWPFDSGGHGEKDRKILTLLFCFSIGSLQNEKMLYL